MKPTGIKNKQKQKKNKSSHSPTTVSKRKLNTTRVNKSPLTKNSPLQSFSQVNGTSRSLMMNPTGNVAPSSLSLSLLPTTTFTSPYTSSQSSFHTTIATLALGGGRSKGTAPVKKKFDTPEKVKKELSQDDKDKKKLEKLEREKAKQATRQAQLSRSAERGKKELELATKKQQVLVQTLQTARAKAAEVDVKEQLELEANAKRNAEEEEAARAAHALRRAQNDV